MLPKKFLLLWHNPSLGMTVTHQMMFMMELALNKFEKCMLTFDSEPFIFICVLLNMLKNSQGNREVYIMKD
jgi:hypothetical protein